jgi:leader peptidase (prepilin peptidase)/N-methyltransferase
MAIFDRAIIGQILWFATLVVTTLGLCVGSFLNVVVWRLPRGESLNHPGSHCPKCGHAIRAWENIPLLSWLFLRGRCSQCGLPISMRYPLVEAANGALWLVLWLRLWSSGLPLTHALAWFFLASALLAIALIDIDHFLIPDKINALGGIVAIVLTLVFPEIHELGNDGPHNLFSRLLADALSPLAGQPRVLALARLAVGAALGYSLLRLVRALGRRLWGRTLVHPDAPAGLRVSGTEVVISGEDPVALADLLPQPEDRMIVEISSGHLEQAEGKSEDWEGGRVEIGPNGLRREGTKTAWTDVTGLRLQAVSWTLPREVLGLGDVKLLAMLGAFLGPDAVLFITAAGALAGTVFGTVLALARRGRCPAVPFGPFLGLAALVWLLAGPELLAAYSAWLLSLVPPPL